MRNSKRFAIDNAGKRFRFGRRIVTVVGYRNNGNSLVGDYVIVSRKCIGWYRNLESEDIKTVIIRGTKYKNFWYVFPEELKPL